MDKIEIIDSERRLARRILPPPDEPRWFAMSAPYSRELKAQAELEARGVENYVPMRCELVTKGAVKKKVMVPVIHNLIFVHSTKEKIQNLKRSIPYLQYRTNREDGKNVPIVVPEKQMQDFMLICGSTDAGAKVYAPGEIDIPKGARVRITGGDFQGVEGMFVKLAGKRGRCVVVQIPVVANAFTAMISPDCVEVIEG